MIKLPSGKEALPIKVSELDLINKAFFEALDLSKAERYVCIWMDYEGEKIFVMALKHELNKQDLLDALKAELSYQMTQIAVKKQLCLLS